MAGQTESLFESGNGAQALLARLRAFFFPEGEDRVRTVLSIRTTQRGEMRMSPGAKWIAFTAEESIEATRSGFCWEARIGGGRFGFTTVTDAYEEAHGRLVVKLGGVIPMMKLAGPDLDRGELQRYLASIISCPAMLLHNRSLKYTTAGPATLRLWDSHDALNAAIDLNATIDLEIAEDGRPVCCRADRPRLEGKVAVLTPWSGTAMEFREWEGMRVASRMEVAWQLPEGAFPYFRGEVTSFAALRG